MAISVNWATKVINVPRADMVLVQTLPTEIRQLDLDVFRLALKDLEDGPGITHVDTHNHNTTVTVGGAILARVVEIINGYTVTFEDGQYAVNLVGANSNVGDVVNVNQVSVRSSNSAGLQDLNSLQAASYGGKVALDVGSSYSGTVFPVGTTAFPVNNSVDANQIAINHGIRTILIMCSMTMATGVWSSGFTFEGISPVVTTLTLAAATDITNCTFTNITIEGVMDNANTIKDCHVLDVTFFNGEIHTSALEGKITLAGGVQATIVDCYSNVAGGGATEFPTVDIGGTGQKLALRGYNGGLGIENAAGVDTHSLDFLSGRAIFNANNTGGIFSIRGVAEVIDNSVGATVIDSTIYRNIQGSAYGGSVFIDTINGGSGTAFPTGTREFPSNSVTDALTIAASRGIDSLEFIGDYTFATGDNISLFNISGQDSSKTTLTFPAGVVTAGTNFKDCTIVGELISPTGFDRVIFGAVTGGTIGLSGTMTIRNCIFTDSVTLSAALIADINIINCATGVTPSAGPAIFDANGANVNLVIHGYSGEMDIRGFTHISVSAEIQITGEVILDASNTAGSIEVNGLAEVVDNSTGTTVTVNALDTGAANIGHKITRNKVVTDPISGVMTVYDEDGVTPILTAQLYEDADGTQTYRGKGGERRERLA